MARALQIAAPAGAEQAVGSNLRKAAREDVLEEARDEAIDG